MSNITDLPSFRDFTKWVAARMNSTEATKASSELLQAATDACASYLDLMRVAQDEAGKGARRYYSEALTLLAAADNEAPNRPVQLTTKGGFGLWLVYDDEPVMGGEVTVLVRCLLPELLKRMVGKTVFLRSGVERFESTPFNPDGEALITLPASIEVGDGTTFEAPVE